MDEKHFTIGALHAVALLHLPVAATGGVGLKTKDLFHRCIAVPLPPPTSGVGLKMEKNRFRPIASPTPPVIDVRIKLPVVGCEKKQ